VKAGGLLHDWNVTPREAIEIQLRLRGRVLARDDLEPVHYVAGVDVGFPERGAVTRAAVAVLSFPGLEPVEQSVVCVPTRFPYVPGLLSFREVPAIVAAFEGIRTVPQLTLCDGQGYAHPRRFGLACHLGLVMDLPCIGVAKSRLVGTHEPLGEDKGDYQPLLDHGEQVGVVLRTRRRVRPLFVSIGHRVGLASAVEYVLACTTRYRLPETTRAADRLASSGRRKAR